MILITTLLVIFLFIIIYKVILTVAQGLYLQSHLNSGSEFVKIGLKQTLTKYRVIHGRNLIWNISSSVQFELIASRDVPYFEGSITLLLSLFAYLILV